MPTRDQTLSIDHEPPLGQVGSLLDLGAAACVGVQAPTQASLPEGLEDFGDSTCRIVDFERAGALQGQALYLVDSYLAEEGQRLGRKTTAWDLNNGLCESWASDFLTWAEEQGIEGLEEAPIEACYAAAPNGEPGYDGIYGLDLDVLRAWGTVEPPSGLTWEDLQSAEFSTRFRAHMWVHDSVNGLHFDAEAPHGVETMFDLPIWKRAVEDYIFDTKGQKNPVATVDAFEASQRTWAGGLAAGHALLALREYGNEAKRMFTEPPKGIILGYLAKFELERFFDSADYAGPKGYYGSGTPHTVSDIWRQRVDGLRHLMSETLHYAEDKGAPAWAKGEHERLEMAHRLLKEERPLYSKIHSQLCGAEYSADGIHSAADYILGNLKACLTRDQDCGRAL